MGKKTVFRHWTTHHRNVIPKERDTNKKSSRTHCLTDQREFPDIEQRDQMQYGSLTELKAQRLEFKVTKMTRFYGAEHQKEENSYIERDCKKFAEGSL